MIDSRSSLSLVFVSNKTIRKQREKTTQGIKVRMKIIFGTMSKCFASEFLRKNQ